MKKKIFAVDIDGCLANFSRRFSQYANEMFDAPVVDSCNDIHSWNWHETYPITKEQEKLVWDRVKNTRDFWLELEPLPKSGLIVSLVDTHIVYFITTRADTKGRSTQEQTCMWLEKTFDIKYPQVIVTKEKGRVVNSLGADFFVDDNEGNCIDVSTKSSSLVYVMDKPYNRNLETEFYDDRVLNFNEFVIKTI